jgi:predicted DNA-binding transcriptional regulator AlpA
MPAIPKHILERHPPMSSIPMNVLTVDQVCQRLTISKPTLFRYAKAGGDFPRRIKIGSRRVGYLESDVERYLAAQHEAARPDVEAA